MVNADTIEWQVSGAGMREHPYVDADKSNIDFDWGKGSNSHSWTRVVCMSKGQGHGWNQVETHLRRGAFPNDLRPKQGQNQDSSRDSIQ